MNLLKRSLEKIDNSWQELLESEFNKDYMIDLNHFLASEKSNKKIIYPPIDQIFTAFELTRLNDTKVVIIGQDPYHGEEQAHGLSFSVKPGVKIPPSLKNIYKELNSDINFEIPDHGFLEKWALQGVLLLNSVLTVEHGVPGSHRNKGWELFTDQIINTLNNSKSSLVFILWGAPAQKKGRKINSEKHLVLKSVHPSPLSSYRGFFGNHHFSLTNEYLKKNGSQEINWEL